MRLGNALTPCTDTKFYPIEICNGNNNLSNRLYERWPEERRREAALQIEGIALLGKVNSFHWTQRLYVFVIALCCVQVNYQG